VTRDKPLSRPVTAGFVTSHKSRKGDTVKLLTVIMLIMLAILPTFRLILAVQTSSSRRYVLCAARYRPNRYYVSLERR